MKKENPAVGVPHRFPEDFRSPQAVEFMKGDSLSILKKSTQRCFEIHDMEKKYSDPSRKMADRAHYSGGGTCHLGPEE